MTTTAKHIMFLGLQHLRFQYCIRLINPGSRTLMDYGTMSGKFVEMARQKGLDAHGTDIENDITLAQDQADVITCFEVLEHVIDPVKAIKNLAGLYRKQLIISVPNEPWFSLWRLGWEPEHLWAVTPMVLKHYLGVPTFEQTIILGRYYVGSWTRKT